MYKRLTSLTLLILMFVMSKAQLSLSVQEPPTGIVQKNQLWNLSLIYSGSNTISVTISITLLNMSDNQPVMTAFSRPITLSKGVKQLKAMDVSPVDYAYVSPAFSRLTDAFIPVGSYRACYTIYNSDRDAKTIMIEDCINLDVQPLSPPQLTMPADSASIQNPYPQFSWLPPAPPTLFSDLNYDLLVTEVREDQTPGAAIQ